MIEAWLPRALINKYVKQNQVQGMLPMVVFTKHLNSRTTIRNNCIVPDTRNADNKSSLTKPLENHDFITEIAQGTI